MPGSKNEKTSQAIANSFFSVTELNIVVVVDGKFGRTNGLPILLL